MTYTMGEMAGVVHGVGANREYRAPDELSMAETDALQELLQHEGLADSPENFTVVCVWDVETGEDKPKDTLWLVRDGDDDGDPVVVYFLRDAKLALVPPVDEQPALADALMWASSEHAITEEYTRVRDYVSARLNNDQWQNIAEAISNNEIPF